MVDVIREPVAPVPPLEVPDVDLYHPKSWLTT